MRNYKFADKCFWGEKWQEMGASGYGCSEPFILEQLGFLTLYEPPCEEKKDKCKYYITKKEIQDLIINNRKSQLE